MNNNIDIKLLTIFILKINHSPISAMVSSLRSKFKHTSTKTNPGIILSPKIKTVYPQGTSVKLIVRPMASAEDAANLPSVKFTCDVSTTVGHILWKVISKNSENSNGVMGPHKILFFK